MNNKDYESTEFYSYKYRNFSTIIIIPVAILVLLLFIGSFFAIKQNVVSSTGVIEPAQVVNIANSNYQEGQVIKKQNQKWLVHLDEKKENIVHLMPLLTAKNKVNIVAYVPANKISAIKKGQVLHFQTANSGGTTDRLTGKVTTIGTYPVRINGGSLYEVVCNAKINSQSNIKYGMEGDATIITGKSTYFEYFKDKVLNRE